MRRKVGVPSEPPPPPRPQNAAGTEVWNELTEQYKNKLTPMYWFMLDDAKGFLAGDEMVVRCGDELTLESLNSPEITSVIKEITSQHLGRDIRVRFSMDTGVADAPEDKLDELIRQGNKFDSFTVKP